ncbi:VirB4-like conjugal transfer ATPase, CD1110 family [Anaeromassilibacillus sp. An200]|uniref:VirB4-like conjugal transfer ATPase, CD1110 family n=1 Tax=Anaeromassilibacillus sp. An200 TaxID=1965587 RepID=UPI000B36635B|nr:TraE family protein [Anaeromassilibacillus sp. An200]OUP11661.1 TraE family protein [Anaeromassilibacillus sp. An200]
MIKTLVRAQKAERERFTVPHSVQDAIPIRRVWPDGIFQAGKQFSKTFSFTDINYSIAGKDEKTSMFLDYSELLNALDSGASAKITIHNRRLDKAEFERALLLPMKEDGLDGYRREYNEMLLSKVTGTNNSVVQERYFTVSVVKKNVDEARTWFSRVGTDLLTHLSRLSSVGRELDLPARLQIFRDFFREGEPAPPFDWSGQARRGHSFKDWFCPDAMEFESDCFRIDGRWGRVLYLRDYASYLKDSMIAELCGLNRSLMLSIDILPVPTDEAVREIQNRMLGIETNAANWQRRQNDTNNFSAVLPYDMEQQRRETREMLEDLTNRDQRMMFGLVTLVHLAESKEQLDSDTESIVSTARRHLCQMSTLRWQQKDGLDTVLPYGLRRIQALRTLTTESTAVLIPFRAQEILQEGGIYYGQNAVSKNMIVADRRKLLNGNSFRLGVSGSGKSFSAKEEIVSIALATGDDILILDPESEFGTLTESLGGEVIRISASSDTHLNAMDMDGAYGDERNPLIEKSEFILSLFEQLIGAGGVSAKEKSILDRCTYDVYREYQANRFQGEPPTLRELYHALLSQPEPEARGLALSSELFITGSLNTFAQHTNVDTKARIIAYDIRELGEQLMPIGMLVTLDAIFNRVIQNWKLGKTTWIFCDEFYLLFRYPYSADFFYKLWKRIRKYNGLVTGLTQNVEELLRSDTARLMLANSEFLILLNQSATDREELARLLHISETQLSYITNVAAGCGLIRCAGNIVPFENSFPRHTRLYRLMTTKPDEVLRGG